MECMDVGETLYVETDLDPGRIAPWLRALAWQFAVLRRGRSWAVGPRDYENGAGAPTVYETVALYALQEGRSFVESDVALSVTLLPLRRRRIALELRRWPPLPVTLETVVRQLTAYFPETCMIVSSVPPPRLERGAPPLACNSWLEIQLAALHPHDSPRALYLPWLEQYRAVRGHYPAEVYRSFRAAVAGCRRRLRRQRRR